MMNKRVGRLIVTGALLFLTSYASASQDLCLIGACLMVFLAVTILGVTAPQTFKPGRPLFHTHHAYRKSVFSRINEMTFKEARVSSDTERC